MIFILLLIYIKIFNHPLIYLSVLMDDSLRILDSNQVTNKLYYYVITYYIIIILLLLFLFFFLIH